ncbi:MAG: hypothetical protein K2P48_06555 [Lachnospiraceae bacterium]|nr:hypothetical protein [Lachnospiraceae bacterium]
MEKRLFRDAGVFTTAIDRIPATVKEDDLREYRTNLHHLQGNRRPDFFRYIPWRSGREDL